MTIDFLSKQIQKEFKAAANPNEAPTMEAYMKNNFKFLGIKKPIRSEILKPYFEEIKKLDAAETLELAKEIWALEEREYQYTAMEILIKAKRKWTDDYFDFFEEMIVDKSWWDSVDAIAANMMGPYVLQHRPKMEKKLKAYATDANMWKRRTSIIYQLHYKDDVSIPILFEHIVLNKDDKQFFIQKAIGWALRQISTKHPALVRSFVETHAITGLAKREALRLID